MKGHGDLDLIMCFIDGNFVIAKKEARGVEKIKLGKGAKIMAVADCCDIPVAISVSSASLHEITPSMKWKARGVYTFKSNSSRAW